MGAETNRLIRLVDDLLTLSRSDAGALSLRLTPVAWSPFVRGVVEGVRTAQLALTVSGPDDQRNVSLDADRMKQVLLNLLANGVAHAETSVHVSIAVEPGWVLAAVADDGPGIASADQARVFDRFVRLDVARARSTKNGESGSGLGLATSRSLVEAHGGTLTIEGANVDGTGARFVVRLPVPA